jgi:protein N-terminal methyltransferase
MENENEELNKEQWYSKTKEHWQHSESSIKGVLGGNDQVHNSDVKTSCELLDGLIKVHKINTKKVLDCGAGIGRVTSSVLTKYFDECDIMEQDEKFVDNCRTNFSNEPKIKDIYQSSLQDFVFSKSYNVIWIQWCLENLDDQDLANFLIKCKNNLEENGMIIIKENIVQKGSKFISMDYSKVRSDLIFKNIFEKSGLKIIRHFHHPNWPKDLLKVSVFVLKVNN